MVETMVAASEAGRSGMLLRVAGICAVVSGAVGVPAVAALILMYAGFAVGASDTAMKFGAINDALIIPAYGLLLPVVPAVHVLVRETGSSRSLLLAIVGTVGIVATMVLQWLLVTGSLTFAQQIGPVSVAMLAVGAWMVGTGYLGRSIGLLPNGVRNGVLGALFVGQPWWAVDLGRRLLRHGTAASADR